MLYSSAIKIVHVFLLENASGYRIYVFLVSTNAESKIKNFAIYWDFNNITTNVSDTIVSTITTGTATTIAFGEEY